MKLTLEVSGITVTIEDKQSEETVSEVVNALASAMLAVTFSESQVKEGFNEYLYSKR